MSAIVEAEKTRAEIVFEQYLSERGLRFEHEAVSGRKKPDYLIHGASSDCIVEVKQIEDPDPRPSGGFDPDRPVRAKIKSARRQKAVLSPVANTTFSALIMLTHYQLSELRLEVWRRLYAMQEAGKPVQANDQSQLVSELAPSLQKSVRYPGTVRIIVVENHHARIPFPADLFRGPFDQLWGWHGDWCGPMWIGATLEVLYNDGVPFYML